MKRARARRVRRALLLSGLALAALDARCYAQAVPAYQDRYIANGTLSPDISGGDFSGGDGTGLARSIRIDGVASIIDQQGPNAPPATHENGFILNAQWDTMSYGAFSADGALRLGEGASPPGVDNYGTASFALHERGLPFDGGWQADNALGDINAPIIALAHLQPRFFLTQSPMEGVDSEWHGPFGLQLVAGVGEPGIFDGIKVPTFTTLGGSTATVGAQWSPSTHWTLGGEFTDANDTNLYYQPISGTNASASNERISSSTGYLAAAYQDGPSRAQLNLIDGTLNGGGNSFGSWVDASHTFGALTQGVGAFRIDPNFAWGNQLITSDVQGGYYRLDYLSRRWSSEFDVEEVASVSGNASTITFLSSNARYQLTRDAGVGAVLNVRRDDDGNAWSAEGYFDQLNDYGTGRAQLDYATDTQTQDGGFTLQQSWKMPVGERLATSVGADKIRSRGAATLLQDSTVVRAALYGGGDLTARLALDATIQWAQAVQGEAATSRSADISLSYRISRAWSVLADYYESRVGSWTPLQVTSPLNPPQPTVIPTMGTRGVFLTVRYQAARGLHFAPLGGAPGSASGRLTGVVYLDANENGRYDAGEAGAPNVTVILDGRFSVRTDASGRFDFPAVAAGHHILTVQSDNLPLPWALVNQGRTEVDVITRDRVDVNIAAVRMK